MSLSGSLLCFLFPSVPSCHFLGQTNNLAVELNANYQGNGVRPGVRGRGRSPHSCVKYYPSAGIEVSSDHFKHRVLQRPGGGRLSGWSSVHCVSPATERPITSYFEVDRLCRTFSVGQEEEANLNFVTKAY